MFVCRPSSPGGNATNLPVAGMRPHTKQGSSGLQAGVRLYRMKALLALAVLLLTTGMTSALFAQAVAGQRSRGDTPSPADSLGTLSSRVTLDDTISVRLAGETLEGRFMGASAAALTVSVDGQIREFQANDVQRVWQRGRTQAKQGMKFGFLAGAAVGVAGAAVTYEDSKWSRGGVMAASGMFFGIVGFAWAGIIGAFLHEPSRVLYQATPSTVRVMPAIGLGQAGVTLSVSF
jgi:hypothetical protein